MNPLRYSLVYAFIILVALSCSKDDPTTLKNNNSKERISNRSGANRSFPIEDLLFQTPQEDLDYIQSIKSDIINENAMLTTLESTLGFGEIMWDAVKIIRNHEEDVTYTFVPVFEPTLYQVSFFFGIKDDNGILTYQIKSKKQIRKSFQENDIDHDIINSLNLFEYFDYNFGAIVSPTYHNQVDGGTIGGDGTNAFGLIDCFQTTYINDLICACGGSHPLAQIDLCSCNSAGYNCACPSTSSSGFIDCWYVPQEFNGGGGGGYSGGTGSTFSTNAFIAGLQQYVGFSTFLSALDLASTDCVGQLESYYGQIIGSEEAESMIAWVNCAILELEAVTGGGCNANMPDNLLNFDFEEVDDELLAWIRANTGEWNSFLINPLCGMIGARYTEEEVKTYLDYLKISLTNEPDPGYDSDNINNPYTAYNIDNSPLNSNKVTNFLLKYPCVKPFEGFSLGLLLSKPEVVDWADDFLDGDCGDGSKSNYTNVVFNVLKSDDEFVPDRFSELYSIFTDNNDDILLDDCNYDVTPWINLASFVIPSEVNARLESLGWSNQDIDATGFWAQESKKVNLDYHSVTIDQLPDLNGDGNATPEELFDELRLNFPNYADGQITVEVNGPDFDVATTWNFYKNDYVDFWNTSVPLKTIVEIDTESNPDGLGSSWLPTGLTDDATVTCSSFEDKCCWVFSTVHTSNFGNSNNGSHPVSGNRQFGLKDIGNGKYEFYIKAADRARISWTATALGKLFGNNDAVEIFFQITDKTWNNLTNNIVSMITNPPNGGTEGIASQNTPITIRPKWSEVRNKLKSEYPLTIIPCDE